MKSLYDALDHYSQQVSDGDGKQLRTALIRYLVPGLGGPSPAGARTKPAEIEVGLEFLKKQSVECLIDALDIQERVFEQYQTTQSSRDTYRYHLRRFIEWAKDQELLNSLSAISVAPQGKADIYFLRKRGGRETPSEYRSRLNIKRRVSTSFRLQSIGLKLQQQIQSFREYRKSEGIRDITISSNLDVLLSLLGWLAVKNSVSEEEVVISDIFRFVRLSYDESDFSDSSNPLMDVFIAQKTAEKKAKKEAERSISLIESHLLEAHSSARYSSLESIIKRLIPFAKWVYRNETKTDDFTDIPVVVELRRLHRQYLKKSQSEPDSVPYALKSVRWEDLPKALDFLKKEADVTHQVWGSPRTLSAKAESLQSFLLVAFFCVMPPCRSRVIGELEIGRTLRRGLINESGFVPEELLPNGLEAKWCICLNPEDDKAGRRPGLQAFILNDFEFNDGTSFYSYLNLWLDKLRPDLKPDHSRVWVITRSLPQWNYQIGDPRNPRGIGHTVAKAMHKALGRPVSPKEFRKMFVSYISNRKDLSEADMENFARAMGHSRKMQMKVYDQVRSEIRLADAQAAHARLWQEAQSASDKNGPGVA